MATTPKRISALTSATTPLGGTEVAAIVQSGTTKKVAVSDIAALAATNAFKTIDCSSGTDPVADSTTDTLTLTGGGGVTVTGDSSADSVTFSSNSRTLATVSTSVDVDNTVTETTIFSYTVPGGTIGTTGRLVLRLDHEYQNNSGGTKGLQWKVKLGGTTVVDYATASNFFSSSSSLRNGKIEVSVQGKGSTTSQAVLFSLYQQSANSNGTLTTGTGAGLYASGAAEVAIRGASTFDMSGDAALVVTVQHSAADPATTWETFGGSLRLEAP